MPQVIHNSGQGSSSSTGSTGKKPDKQNDKKPLIIGAGVMSVLVLIVAIVMMVRSNAAPTYEKVLPPAGFPDQYPYNSKDYQKRGMPAISGVPPQSVMQQFKNPDSPKQ